MDAWKRDEELAQRCLAGDAQAWRELVETGSPLVYSLCRQAGLSADDADDICQETMLSALRSLPQYGGCRLTTWLYRLTRRRLADYFRSPRRRHLAADAHGDDAAREATTDAVAEEQLLDDDRNARVRAGVAALEEPQRSVVVAYYLAQMPVRDIAAELRMPVSTVKSHLHRGRQELRRQLKEPDELR